MTQTQWTESKYPGSTILTKTFIRNGEHGDVRIEQYDNTEKGTQYRIGTFLPGRTECSSGDTPKIWPEREMWRKRKQLAERIFYQYCALARSAGWTEYVPNATTRSSES